MAPGVGGYRQINKALNICAFEDYLESQQTHLPHLPDVEQLSPRVIRVLGQNPGKFTLQGTNTYIIGTGTHRILLDTGQGIPDWITLLSSTLSTHGITLSHVLLTHWHGDHTGGVPDLLTHYPHLSSAIFKHTPEQQPPPKKGSKSSSQTGTQQHYQQQPIVDGQIFRVEGATVRAVHAPGHSHDHCCFLLEEEDALFTGDNVLGHGTAAVEHLRTWMGTLRLMLGLGCKGRGYPAHGAVIVDLKGKMEGELNAKIKREAQVLRALRGDDSGGGDEDGGEKGKGLVGNANGGGTGRKGRKLTVKELVVLVYGDKMDDAVREMALEPFVDEVLRKLAEDGMVGFDVRGGVKRWFALA